MPPDAYPGAPGHAYPPAPVPPPGYGVPPPAADMGAGRGGYRPRPAVVDATGPGSGDQRHAK